MLKEKFPKEFQRWSQTKQKWNFRRWLAWYRGEEGIQKEVKSLRYMTPMQAEMFEQAVKMKQPWGNSAKPISLLKYVEHLLGVDSGYAAGIIAAALDGARDDVMDYIKLALKYVSKYKPPWAEEAVKRSLKRFQKYIVDPSAIPADIAASALPQDEKVVEAYKREAHDYGQPGRVDKAVEWWNAKYADIIKSIPANLLPSILGASSGQTVTRLMKEPYDLDYDKKMALFESSGFNMHQQRINFGIMRKILEYVARLASVPEGKASEWARQFGVDAGDIGKGGPYFLMVEMLFPYAYGISAKYVRIAKKNVGVRLVSKEQLEGGVSGEGKGYEMGDPEDWGAAGKRKQSDEEVEIEASLSAARFYRFIALAMIAGEDMD